MTTLAEIVSATKWPEIRAALTWLYPQESERVDNYRLVWRDLLAMEPAASGMRIAIEAVPAADLDDAGWVDVVGRDGTTNAAWSLALCSWKEWLGMSVEPATLQAFSPAHFVAHCLYEMTFHGFCESDVQDVHDELKRRMAELDAMSDEEKAEKLIPWEQVKAELGDGRVD